MVPKTCSVLDCDRSHKSRGYCGPHYADWFRKTPESDRLRVLPTVEQRFWAKVDKSGECWEWTAAKDKRGYGFFHPRKPLTVRAHRYSLELHLGRPVDPTLFVCHTCDNPSCVRPEHLYEGTSQDNVNDAVERQRHKRGEMDPNAKLTEADVVEIRLAVAAGEKNRSAAARYGVRESLISGIVRGNRWQHAGGPLTEKYQTKRKAA